MSIDDHHALLYSLPAQITTWMSHTDQVVSLPKGFKALAHTSNTKYAAIGDEKRKIYGVQFHPEVAHTQQGLQIISNFLFLVAECNANCGWRILSRPRSRRSVTRGKNTVICGLSGGVDSSTAAVLINKAIGKQLKCIFVNNGLLRKDEAKYVVTTFSKGFDLDLHYADSAKLFLDKLAGVIDPEQKRKIIGHEFITVFDQEAKKIKNAKFLVQGTLYPDVIESTSAFGGPTARIKSHHNVGGLPKDETAIDRAVSPVV